MRNHKIIANTQMIHLKGRVFHVNTKVQTRHGSLMCNNSLLLYLKLCF